MSSSSPHETLHEPLTEELRDYFDQFEAIKRDADRLVQGVTPVQLGWRAEPGRWSIAECLEHLVMTGSAYLPEIDRAIERARAQGWRGTGRSRPTVVERWILRSTEPPPRVRLKAMRGIAPKPDAVHELVVPRFFAVQEQLQQRLERANGLDLARSRVVSPLARLLRFRLGFTFAFLLAHERRHLWQAWRVREHPSFPSR